MIGIINKIMMYVLHQNKYFLNCLWTFVFIPTHKSSAAKFTARKELKWMILVKGLVLTKKKSVKCFKTEKFNR